MKWNLLIAGMFTSILSKGQQDFEGYDAKRVWNQLIMSSDWKTALFYKDGNKDPLSVFVFQIQRLRILLEAAEKR